jgi:hypothetical protein
MIWYDAFSHLLAEPCILKLVVLAAEPEIEIPEFDVRYGQGAREAGFQATL